VILCGFAIIIGSLTVHRIRADFNRQVADAARALPSQMKVTGVPFQITPELRYLATPGDKAVIKVLSQSGAIEAQYPERAPSFTPPEAESAPVGAYPAVMTVHGYRVITQRVPVLAERDGGFIPVGHLIIQYGRPVGPTEATVHRVELFLLLGVLAGSVLALWAGMLIARRAMSPIAQLTTTAAEIARTRDTSRHMPEPLADDEVAELSRTLESMLRELDAARGETEAALRRQRQFVADASHELRTPLTSVLANLEVLAESLDGDQGETARSALRSSQRMRRLVGDLLLLARTDAARVSARERCDLGELVLEAAAELGPVTGEHEIALDVRPAPVVASHDEVLRLTLNLVENALRHTPPGTVVRVATCTVDGHAQLVVEDDGPGIPAALRNTLFDRFVRGEGDRGGSFGLGLAIVKAVATSHGGTVVLEQSERGSGARFVVRLPAATQPPESAQAPEPRVAGQAV
jgi:signal transduction histidine kinase